MKLVVKCTFTTVKGKEDSIEFNRNNPSSLCHYHTHPRNGTHDRILFLPPSPFDIVSLMWVDYRLTGKKKIGIVIGREGIYVMQSMNLSPVDLDIVNLRAEAILYRYYLANAKAIFFFRDHLFRYFQFAESLLNTHVDFYPWPSVVGPILITYLQDDVDIHRHHHQWEDFHRRDLAQVIPEHEGQLINVPECPITAYEYYYLVHSTEGCRQDILESLEIRGVELG
jgi:hypothetical protein